MLPFQSWVIVGGIIYAASSSDETQVRRAKVAIQYAVIGLVVSLFAWAIVNWVVGSVMKRCLLVSLMLSVVVFSPALVLAETVRALVRVLMRFVVENQTLQFVAQDKT